MNLLASYGLLNIALLVSVEGLVSVTEYKKYFGMKQNIHCSFHYFILLCHHHKF